MELWLAGILLIVGLFILMVAHGWKKRQLADNAEEFDKIDEITDQLKLPGNTSIGVKLTKVIGIATVVASIVIVIPAIPIGKSSNERLGESCDTGCRYGTCITPDGNRYSKYSYCSYLCSDDSDCPSEYHCDLFEDEKYCIRKPTVQFGGECRTAQDCEGGACIGQHAFSNIGICTRKCTSDRDCPNAYKCGGVSNLDGEYCLLKPTAGYRDNCHVNADCKGGLCMLGNSFSTLKYCTMRCKPHTKCPGGYPCVFNYGIHYCAVPGFTE